MEFGNIRLEHFTPPSVHYSHRPLIFKGQEAWLPGRIVYLRLPSPHTFNDHTLALLPIFLFFDILHFATTVEYVSSAHGLGT